MPAGLPGAGAPPSAGGAPAPAAGGAGSGSGTGSAAMAGPEAAGAAAAAEGSEAGNGGGDGYDGKCVFCRIARREEPGTALLPCEVREAPPSPPSLSAPSRAGPGVAAGAGRGRGGSEGPRRRHGQCGETSLARKTP